MPDAEVGRVVRLLLDDGGAGRAILGMFVRARTATRERLVEVPLEQGQTALNVGLKLQGQMKGLDLAIDIIFDLANFKAEDENG